MNNSLTLVNTPAIFENAEFGKVRAFMRNGEPWFVASDVATALGYNNPSRSVQDHCKYAELLKTTSGVVLDIPARGLLVIPESDVYALIFRSNLPKAEEFRRWVCEEVLPAIRKTGQYSLAPKNYVEALRRLADEVEAKQRALAVVEEQKQVIEAQEIALGDARDWKAVTAIPWLIEYFSDTSTATCSRIGKVLSAISRRRGLEIRKTPHNKYRDGVNVYHISVIEAFKEILDADPQALADIRK